MSLILQVADLAPIVAEALGQSAIELVEWNSYPLSAGASVYWGGLGVYRVAGTARAGAELVPWSSIVKIAKGEGPQASNDPVARNYWKREALVYSSDLLNQLPPGIGAPRCYAIQERAADECWLWLEEIQAAPGPWTTARHGLAARHLGQFNGAYLAGYPLPLAQPWMTWGRARLEGEAAPSQIARCRQYANTPLAQRWFGRAGLDHTFRLWAQLPRLLQAFEQLPVCYCHHDAHRRNLLDRQPRHGGSETIAIDWALTGFGRIGEEVGVTTAVGLEFLEVPAAQAYELDQAVFTGYLEGLRDAGWQGDSRLARLGYTLNAFLLVGSDCAWIEQLLTPEGRVFIESVIGHPFDTIMAQWAEMWPFILKLGDEALALVDLRLGG